MANESRYYWVWIDYSVPQRVWAVDPEDACRKGLIKIGYNTSVRLGTEVFYVEEAGVGTVKIGLV